MEELFRTHAKDFFNYAALTIVENSSMTITSPNEVTNLKEQLSHYIISQKSSLTQVERYEVPNPISEIYSHIPKHKNNNEEIIRFCG